MVSTTERIAEQSDALRRAQMGHMAVEGEPVVPADLQAGLTDAHYLPPENLDPQWLSAWKMLLDRDGNEYGIPVWLPRGQWDQGGSNALMNQKGGEQRPDGGYHFQLQRPDREMPAALIECFVGDCRKKLHKKITLVQHVRAFHNTEAEAYRVVLERIEQQAISEDPRLQRMLDSLDQMESDFGGDQSVMVAVKPEGIFYCVGEGCTRFFDTEKGRDFHARKEHKA